MHWKFASACVLAALLMSCGSSRLSGRFADAAKPTTYVEFHDDGTAYAQDEEGSVSGTYRLDGDEIVLTMSNGHAEKFQHRGNTLVGNRVTLTRQ